MAEQTRSSNDDDALSALLDGALPRDEAAALRARLEREPALAARLAAMERANRAVRDAYRDVVHEPLPERVLELLNAPREHRDNVVDLGARTRRRAWRAFVPHAAAAGIALAIGVGLGVQLGQSSSEAPVSMLAATGAVEPSSPLHELLESVPSGEPRALDAVAMVEARLTFRALDGSWCRELTVTSADAGSAALACRREGGWHIELVAPTAAGGALYRPAGAGEAPFEEAIDSLIDGEPLEPEAERALVARGWAND